jgi:mannosyltransferase OCH1-like enzyme
MSISAPLEITLYPRLVRHDISAVREPLTNVTVVTDPGPLCLKEVWARQTRQTQDAHNTSIL